MKRPKFADLEGYAKELGGKLTIKKIAKNKYKWRIIKRGYILEDGELTIRKATEEE